MSTLISHSQRRLELGGTFAPDKQLFEVNFHKWKSTGFGYYLSLQGGNFGNRLYDNKNRDGLGRTLTATSYIFYQMKHDGFLFGSGLSYFKKINKRYSYSLNVGFMLGFQRDERTFQWKNGFSDYIFPVEYKIDYRIQGCVIYRCSIGYMVTKKIGVNVHVLIPYYYPLTSKFYSNSNVNDAINIGFEPAFSVAIYYQWKY